MIFRDLGPLRVEMDDLEVPLPGRRLGSVLARLVASVGETVSIDALIEATWGDRPPARAQQALETLVWRLRALLEPGRAARAEATLIRKQEHGYRLAVPPDAVDSRRFADLADRAARALTDGDVATALRLSEWGLSLWRGQPYESLPDADWLAPVRQQLVARRLDLGVCHVQALLDACQPERALTALLPLIEEQPFHEVLWGQRMLGLYRSGRQSDALTAYADVQRLLAEELGIDPGPELRSLHAKVLDQSSELDLPEMQAPPPERFGPVRLPSRRGPLIGRDETVADIVKRVEAHRLITLIGPGGAGKTRVAVEVGHRLIRHYPDGVWFVDLAELRPEATDAARLRDVVAATLELAPRVGITVDQLLADDLRKRRLLLVIDNCEQVSDAVAAVAYDILDWSRTVSILATSREALEVAGENVVALSPLTSDDAIALFVDRLAGLRPDVDPLGKDRPEIDRICDSMGGLPLGIELAAARARVFELTEVAASLADGMAGPSSSGGPRRHASMLDAVDWSYRLAQPQEQILHRRLVSLPGPFTVDAARALCSVGPLAPDQAPALLAGLTHRSLLMSLRPNARGPDARGPELTGPGAQSSVTRFRQLVPTQLHARRLIELEEQKATGAALHQWVVDRVLRAELGGTAGQAEASAWVRDNTTAVTATLTSYLIETPEPAALELLARLMLYWFERGQLLDAAHWYRAAVAAADRGTFTGHRAVIARTLDLCVRSLGQDRAAAARIADRLPELTSPPGDLAPLVGELLLLVGVSTWVAQRPEVGVPATRAARELGEQLSRPDIVVRARALSDMHHLTSPRSGKAIADARSILAEDQDNEFASFVASYACAIAAFLDSDPGSALTWMRRTALAHRRLAMHPTSELLEDVARLLACAGQQTEAVRCYAAAHAMHAHDGLPWPRLPHSAGVIEHLESVLTTDDYTRLWSSGARLGRSHDPITLLDEWLPESPPVRSATMSTPA